MRLKKMAHAVLQKIPTPFQACFQCFHTSPQTHKSEKIFRKLIGGTNKKKHHYSNMDISPTPDIFKKTPSAEKKVQNHKRMSTLNKLFMRHITDLMATGQSSSELLGRGIEINRVKVTPDYNTVRIYWISRETKDEQNLEKLLHENAGILRHELSQLRVMGVVPKLTFIKDKQYAEILEIDSRLAKADFGNEHMPIDIADKLKTQLELYTDIDQDTKETIQRLDQSANDDDDTLLPPMPQDVLGLNHSDILNRVKKQMKKSEALHRLSSNQENQETAHITPNTTTTFSYPDSKSERIAFKEFLTKRQMLQSKMKTTDKNYTPDLEYIKEELHERSAQYFDNIVENENNDSDCDYLIEDEVNEK